MSLVRRVTYQIYLRIQRGGVGVNYRAGRDEVLAAAASLHPRIVSESQARMRLLIETDPPADAQVAAIGPLLGYTEAIFRRVIVPYDPALPTGEQVGRFLVGARRFGHETHVFEPLFFADEAARIASSPHERKFTYLEGGQSVRGQRQHVHRRMSPCDAKLMLNLALADSPGGVPRVVDPFAGIGGIVVEAVARGLDVLCGDVDAVLAPGLAEISRGRAVIWDARRLPLQDDVADAVVTEPPYHRDLQEAVHAALPEISRVLKPGRKLALLIAGEMEPQITRTVLLTDLKPVARYALKRQKMLAALLLYRKPE